MVITSAPNSCRLHMINCSLVDVAGCVVVQAAGKDGVTGAPDGEVPAPPGQRNRDDNRKEANLHRLCLTVVSLWEAHFFIFALCSFLAISNLQFSSI